MLSTAFLLIVLYWGNDGRSAMTSVEFASQETCEAAKADVAKTMDGWSGRTYSVCVRK